MKKLVLFACLIAGYLNANSQGFTAGNLAVLRVGNGTSTINTNGLPVNIIEYQTNGTASGINIAVPSTDAGNRLIMSASTPTEGAISLSADGRFLVFGGYDAASGSGYSTLTTSTKVFSRIAASGNIDISTKIAGNGYSNAVRSVVSNDGNSFWAVGANNAANQGIGLYHIEFGTNTYTSIASVAHRSALIVGGQLYTVGNINKIGDGLPTAPGATVSNYGSLGSAFSNINIYGFVLFDMSDTEDGFDVMYAADQGHPTTPTPGLKKFSKVGGTWVSNGTLDVSSLANAPATAPGALLDITGTLNEQSKPVLYASRGTGPSNSLISIIDQSGYNETINATPTHLASAGAGYIFKGVAFTPGTTIKVLPLDLLSFSSSLNNSTVSLKWTTENEVNIKAIEVERKSDNSEFVKIGSVSPKNTKSTSNYTFEDRNTIVGNNYYRLKIVDQDGTFKYSEVSVQKVLSLQSGSSLILFPNPAKELLNVTHSSAAAGATITIYSLSGKVEIKEKLKELATSSTIAIGKLSASTYVIQIDNAGVKESKTFIKK